MEPVQIGKKFFHGVAGTFTAIVEPSANTAGVTIRTGTLFSSVLYTGTTKPNWTQNRTFPVLFKTLSAQLTTIPYSISIPAGYGLWLGDIGNVGEAYITYDILA